MSRMQLRFLLVAGLLIIASAAADAGGPKGVSPERLPGLKAAAEITRDDYGIAHIRAGNEHDLFFLQGYVHAAGSPVPDGHLAPAGQRDARRTARPRRDLERRQPAHAGDPARRGALAAAALGARRAPP